MLLLLGSAAATDCAAAAAAAVALSTMVFVTYGLISAATVAMPQKVAVAVLGLLVLSQAGSLQLRQ